MELKQKSWIFDYPKLTQHALEAEAPTHNLGIWKRIQGGTALALEDPIDFESEPWPRLSADCRDLVMKLMERDPERRITARAA